MNLALLIFGIIFVLIITEVFDKTVLALLGAVLMVLLGILTFEQAAHAIDFETIVLLMSMMIIVEIAKKSELFALVNVKIANVTKGNPLMIYLLFLVVTAVFSAFLDNVTTILIVVPITIGLLREMSINPKIFVISEIMVSNIGGALTLIGDPPNIIIGSQAGLSFNSFVANLWIPISISITLVTLYTVVRNWSVLKPISHDLKRLFLSSLLIRKLNILFGKKHIVPVFLWGATFFLVLTVVGFFTHSVFHISPAVVALTGAVLMLVTLRRHISLHRKLAALEWTTLLFFAGLFVMVAGVEQSGFLEEVSRFIVDVSGDNFLLLLLMIVWVSGVISMVFNNIPFITVMIPVIFQIQSTLPPEIDPNLLWWALSLGTCLGGNGTVVGASANLVGVSIADQHGLKITFWEYLKIALPLTLVMLGVVSGYFFLLVG